MTSYVMKFFWSFKNMDKLFLKLFLWSANEAVCLTWATNFYTIKWCSFLSRKRKSWTNTFENYRDILKRFKLKIVLFFSTAWTSSCKSCVASSIEQSGHMRNDSVKNNCRPANCSLVHFPLNHPVSSNASLIDTPYFHLRRSSEWY